ncbi:TPA: ANR family transcriptional regulator [Serratia marcescens]
MKLVHDGVFSDTQLSKMSLRSILHKAANLEQAGVFDEAALYWSKGGGISEVEEERNWCEARALFCQKRSLKCDYKT